MALTPIITSPGDSGSSTIKGPHTITIDKRRQAVITGVLDVSSFQENEVVLKIESGEMVLSGQNLHISKLLLEDGQLHVDGHVDGVAYQSMNKHEGKGRFLKRLFK